MAMMEPVQVGMKQRDGPLVKRIRHRRPLFFSSFGRIGMPCFSLMVKRNGACQHAGNEGLHAQKLGGSFPKYMGSVSFVTISTLIIQNRNHPGLYKSRRILHGFFLKSRMRFPVAIMHGGQISD